MSILETLRPQKRERVMDLVQRAGLDVSEWGNSARGVRGAAMNPRFCYKWSFVQAGCPVVVSFWYEDLEEEEDGTVRLSVNLREEIAVHSKTNGNDLWRRRAERLDEALQQAYRERLPIRMILCSGLRRSKYDRSSESSRVKARTLDPSIWSVRRYESRTGEYLLERAGVPAQVPTFDHSNSLRILVSREEIASAQHRLCARFAAEASATAMQSFGFPGGTLPARAYWLEGAGIWGSFEQLPSRHWNAFGLGNPFDARGSTPITVEINPPLEGIKRNTQGLFAEDRERTLYFLHRGKIGGRSQRISRDQFLAEYNRHGSIVTVTAGKAEEAFAVVGIVDDPDFLGHVASFVRFVDRFKASTRNVSSGASLQPDRGFSYKPEFSGVRVVPARQAIAADCRHGAVVDSLRRLLENHGFSVGNDRLQDLVVHDKQKIKCVFEVKSTSDRQAVYTGIGQLVLHASNGSDRILVVPDDLPDSLRSDIIKAGFGVVTYKMNNGVAQFMQVSGAFKLPRDKWS